MIALETICPYTGLRSFSEDESLYFKGRDSQITRVIAQLEQKKFLMVTGASGDGKSSLIFAGLIPEARAGFFKAQYSNWHVVSFRPERSPLTNMAKALAGAFNIDDPATVQNELNHGFSSLAQIYKSTSLFIDQKDASWANASAETKLTLDREAGNLLVVVDQFEEFFTNPENFPNGVPSQDARLVLNILLETVKIALRDDLPIYIVFTMRSDYIGQCAAFRGLPEFIGFSQFFVPRLQRKELQQVIEEPAILSGNRISKRLVDRLIYDLEDTEDHLPILQHVLKEIWKAADDGRQVMDLLQYAMVGGMSGGKLPKEDIERFRLWEEQLPPQRREVLKNAGLSNVLDIHATRLYLEAASSYNKEHEVPITEKDAKLIIGITFACLTRIDENRAVRNRMTLEEITRIINVPRITTSMVDDVLRPFRDQHHTLVRPFIQEDGSGRTLQPDTVLDITHEALIRNWKLLNRWAAKEFEYYNTYIDFRKQLQRWIDNGQSSDYLLPIGPLTYFENWFKNCRPNAWWINRYNTTELPPAEKIQQSESILNHSNQFLKKSAWRLFVTRSFMKYGAGKISAVIVGLALLVTAGFLIHGWWTQRNEVVVERLLSNGDKLLPLRTGSAIAKSEFILTAERLHPGFFKAALRNIPDAQQQLDIALQLPAILFGRNKYSKPPILETSLVLADSLIRAAVVPPFVSATVVDTYMTNWNDLLNIELNYLYFNEDARLKKRFETHSKQQAKFLYDFLTTADPTVKWEKKTVNIALAHTLNLHALSSDSVSTLIATLSPFEVNEGVTKRFQSLFPATGTVAVGTNQVIEHNGGYEMLANLYASQGKADKALRCMDTILRYRRNYDLNFANSRNVATYFLIYNHDDAYKAFVKGYAQRIGLKSHEFMRGLSYQAGVFDVFQEVRAIKHGNYNPNLAMLSGAQLDKVFDQYKDALNEEVDNADEKIFALALLAKHHGMVLTKKSAERREAVDEMRRRQLFDEAVSQYAKLSKSFLDSEIQVFSIDGLNGANKTSTTRNRIFIYPDHFNLLLPNFFSGACNFYGDAFFRYINEKKLLQQWYKSADDYGLLNQWVGNSFTLKDIIVPLSLFNRTYLNYPWLDHDVFVLIDSTISRSGFASRLDNSWVQLKLINDFLEDKKTDKALAVLDRVNFDNLGAGRRTFAEVIPLHNYGTQTAIALIKAGYPNRVAPFVYRFKVHENRMVTFAQLGIASFNSGMRDQANSYMDSVNAETKRMTNITDFQFRSFYDLRNSIVRLITLLKEDAGRKEILDLTGAMVDQKVPGIGVWATTYASMGKYYAAESVIPDLANPDDRLLLYSNILYREVLRIAPSENNPWHEYDEDSKRLISFVIYGQELI